MFIASSPGQFYVGCEVLTLNKQNEYLIHKAFLSN